MNSLYLSVSQKCVRYCPQLVRAGHYCQIVGWRGGARRGGGGEQERGGKAESCKAWFPSRSVAILWVLMESVCSLYNP